MEWKDHPKIQTKVVQSVLFQSQEKEKEGMHQGNFCQSSDDSDSYTNTRALYLASKGKCQLEDIVIGHERKEVGSRWYLL